jgi:hypothetical protein
MNWKLDKFRVPKWMVFVVVMLFVILLLGAISYFKDPKSFFPGVLGGLGSGLAVLLLDKWLDKKELQFLINRDYLKESIPLREDQAYYGKLISECKKNIDFIGKTGVRFLRDFADMDSASADRRLLLSAMQRKVKIRFLLADKSVLGRDASKVDDVMQIYERIKGSHPDSAFEIKFYKFSPAISFFRSDDTVIFGANLPSYDESGELSYKSRHTPSVVAGVLSEVSKSYIEFFEDAWARNA